MSVRASRSLRRLLAAGVAAAALVLTVSVAPAFALAPTTPDSGVWQVNGRVRSIIETGNVVYLGGAFTDLVGPSGQLLPRAHIAALDATTGQPLPFSPVIDNLVIDIAVSPDGQTVYAAGQFQNAGGVARKNIAAFDATTGAVLPFNPSPNGVVEAVYATATQVYLGGRFTKLGKTSRAFLASVSPATGAILPAFTAYTDDKVHDITMTPDGTELLIGGLFNSVSGNATQRKIAALNPTTGAALSWASHPNVEMFDLTVSNGQVFAAGGGSGGHVYGFDLATGNLQWSSLSNGDVHGVAEQNGVLYVGGHFTTYNGAPASHIAAISPTTGRVLPWGVNVNSQLGVWILSAANGHLSVGGDFTRINGKPMQHYMRFTEAVDTQPPTVPGKPVATADTPASADVTWAASTDNTVQDVIYRVYRDGGTTPIAEVTSSSTTTVTYTDGDLPPGSTHTWRVTASDGANTSLPSPASDPLTLPNPGYPVVTSMTMQDQDTDGRVDAVVVNFSGDVTCASPCTSPWTLSGVPSNGHLTSATASGSTVTLHIAEGSGAPDTSVGSFTVALAASPNGVVDSDGNQSRFPATAPADGAAPVPVNFTSTDGDHIIEPGDTFTVTFSEPMDPTSLHPDNVKEINNGGDDQLIITGLTNGPMDLGSATYIGVATAYANYGNATMTVLPTSGGTQIRSVVPALCNGPACGSAMAGTPMPITYEPEPTLTDLAGNHAAGSLTKTAAVF